MTDRARTSMVDASSHAPLWLVIETLRPLGEAAFHGTGGSLGDPTRDAATDAATDAPDEEVGAIESG